MVADLESEVDLFMKEIAVGYEDPVLDTHGELVIRNAGFEKAKIVKSIVICVIGRQLRKVSLSVASPAVQLHGHLYMFKLKTRTVIMTSLVCSILRNNSALMASYTLSGSIVQMELFPTVAEEVVGQITLQQLEKYSPLFLV